MPKYVDLDILYKVLDESITPTTRYRHICLVRDIKTLLDSMPIADVVPRQEAKQYCPSCGVKLEEADEQPKD